MDAAQALADLTEVSSQIEGAVLAEANGSLLAETWGDAGKAERVSRGAADLLEEARAAGRDGAELVQVVAETAAGAVFVLRSERHLLAAVTVPQPTVGLISYDLKTCLRLLEKEKGGAKKARSRKGSDA